MRLRKAGVVLGILGAATTLTTAACAPPAHAPQCRQFHPQFDILDNLNDVVGRAGTDHTVCIQDPSYITQSSGTPWGYSVGWAGIFEGGKLDILPQNSSGVTGNWQPSRPFTATYRLQLSYTLWGYGFHVARGGCVLTDQVRTFGVDMVDGPVSVHCDMVRPRVLATVAGPYIPEGTAANKAAYYRLTPAQKTAVVAQIDKAKTVSLHA